MSVGTANYVEEWDTSYENGDNNILYPQTEVVRFLNRYISKRNNDGGTTRILQRPTRNRLKGLDFACGVGTHCRIMADFDVEGYGVDISAVAIDIARKHCDNEKEGLTRFQVLDASKQKLPFEDNFFDFVIAESCLDSMSFEVAEKYIAELRRVTSGLIYASFIGFDNATTTEEFTVTTKHEYGTVQSVFDEKKISQLLDTDLSDLEFIRRVDQVDPISDDIVASRYYCAVAVQ